MIHESVEQRPIERIASARLNGGDAVEDSPRTDPATAKVQQRRLAEGHLIKKRKRVPADEFFKKLRDADALLAVCKTVGELLQPAEVSEATLSRCRSEFGGLNSEEANRLKTIEEENR